MKKKSNQNEPEGENRGCNISPWILEALDKRHAEIHKVNTAQVNHEISQWLILVLFHTYYYLHYIVCNIVLWQLTEASNDTIVPSSDNPTEKYK